jgi:hypothetical protein
MNLWKALRAKTRGEYLAFVLSGAKSALTLAGAAGAGWGLAFLAALALHLLNKRGLGWLAGAFWHAPLILFVYASATLRRASIWRRWLFAFLAIVFFHAPNFTFFSPQNFYINYNFSRTIFSYSFSAAACALVPLVLGWRGGSGFMIYTLMWFFFWRAKTELWTHLIAPYYFPTTPFAPAMLADTWGMWGRMASLDLAISAPFWIVFGIALAWTRHKLRGKGYPALSGIEALQLRVKMADAFGATWLRKFDQLPRHEEIAVTTSWREDDPTGSLTEIASLRGRGD